MNKSLIAAIAATASLLAAGSAQAGHVHWSIGINLPPVAVISSGPVPVYAPAPVYAPPPVVYAPPPPVVYMPPPVVYAPAPVVYTPPRVIYPAPRVVYPAPVPVVYGPPHRHGPGWGDRDRDGIPNWQDRYPNRPDPRGYRDYRDDRKYRH